MTETNWNELIDKLLQHYRKAVLSESRVFDDDIGTARTALLTAIEAVERERDEAILRANNEGLHVENLEAQLTEAEADAKRFYSWRIGVKLTGERYCIFCEKEQFDKEVHLKSCPCNDYNDRTRKE